MTYQANGKILLSGEYLVLDGALALGIPVSLGQRMSIKESSGSELVWQSFKPNGEQWFTGKFDLFGFDPIKSSNPEIAARLKSVFEAAVRLNSDFLSKWYKYRVDTFLEFEPEWGLGSSSTLISCIAEWADVDEFDLMEMTFGGSGYDIACAKAKGPIFFQNDPECISVDPADFNPSFTDQLYLIYLGTKVNSRDQIGLYRRKKVKTSHIEEISQLTKAFCNVTDLKYFEELMVDHEKLVAGILEIPRIKDQFFNDYWGEIKSLGAWGGDFILASSTRTPEETKSYFNQKGFDVLFHYEQMALSATHVEERV
ncbi:MAG: GHMP kinase [Saprospiraceae bacterium]|nr:GHMP kinase [Saprospiraceae bacterium]